jgi:hypothetical protein
MSSPSVVAIRASGPGASAARRWAAAVLPHVLLLGVALAAWIDALRHTDLARISGYGLLPALPAIYYVALVALAIGFLVAVARRPVSPWLLGVYVLALVVVLHATTPLLYPEPRYAWTYNHLGVTEFIAHFGATKRSVDLYQNWPAFFALAAMLERVSGVSLTAMAPWAEVFFEAAYVAAVVFLVRGLSRDARVVWTAAWLFVLANWLGQDYFAPQSFAYLLSLVLIGLCVRCAPPSRRDPAPSSSGVSSSGSTPSSSGPEHLSPAARWFRWIERLGAGRREPWVDDADSAPLRPPSALLIGGVLFAAITTSHQLSPLLCIVAIGAFAATTRRISYRVLVAMVVLELGWLAAAWPLLASKYHLLEFSPLERPVSAGSNGAWALPGLSASTFAARASVAIICVLAAAALWRRWRSGHFDLPLIAIVLAPVLVVGIQAYNGEGIFRIYLFALPWLCFLVATLLVPRLGRRSSGVQPSSRRRRFSRARRFIDVWRSSRAWRMLPLAAATALLGGTLLFAYYGRELIDYITPQDVAIVQWYERNAPPGSAVVYLAPNVPNRLTYRYAEKQVWAGSFSPSLTEDPTFLGHALGSSTLAALEAKLRGLQATQAYVMIAPSQVNYVRALGLLPPGSVAGLTAALRASSDFQLVANDGNALLFRLVGSEPGAQ